MYNIYIYNIVSVIGKYSKKRSCKVEEEKRKKKD